jgi:DNA polymerase II small subunit/DNA polymerase delta subunit B
MEYDVSVIVAFTVFISFVIFSVLHLYLASKVEERHEKELSKQRSYEYKRGWENGFDEGRESQIKLYEAEQRLRSDLETDVAKTVKKFKKKLDRL